MPVSGPLNPFAFRIANALVGNPPDTAALEIRMVGPQFRVEAKAVRGGVGQWSSFISVAKNVVDDVVQWRAFKIAPEVGRKGAGQLGIQLGNMRRQMGRQTDSRVGVDPVTDR